MDYVYIADFTENDRDILLEALWKTTLNCTNKTMNFELIPAKTLIYKNNGYANYVLGRILNISIYFTDTIDPYEYDKTNGIGTVQDIIDCIRTTKKKNNLDILTIFDLTLT